MADSTCLAGHATAVDAADDIELFTGACKSERLADDELEGLKAEIIVNLSVVDDDLAGAGIKTDSGD